ncbi:hypothetical protein ACQZ6F_17820 [Rhizobium sp. A22-96]
MSDSADRVIVYKYNVTPQHKIYHADGMYGGNNTQNKLVVSFYAEKPPSPEVAKLELKGGVPQGPEEFTFGDAVERDIDVSISMDLNVAIAFYVWMEEKVRNMTEAAGMPKEELTKMLEGARGGHIAL